MTLIPAARKAWTASIVGCTATNPAGWLTKAGFRKKSSTNQTISYASLYRPRRVDHILCISTMTIAERDGEIVMFPPLVLSVFASLEFPRVRSKVVEPSVNQKL